MTRSTRTDDQLKGDVTASAKLARQITSDPMSTPADRNLANLLHESINNNLDELDRRK
ncbi:hypothetical protein [Streptomyces parvus]|uniref:Uncharacterized protein n=1 Tax=Streptomyces parvus TaxID=66428 RepID=A0A7K3RRW1_9ACTN|nr:hypothetical protein [Streptomyces parvus]NEC17945.1 hypothetical protein [Streptomyces parvus]